MFNETRRTIKCEELITVIVISSCVQSFFLAQRSDIHFMTYDHVACLYVRGFLCQTPEVEVVFQCGPSTLPFAALFSTPQSTAGLPKERGKNNWDYEIEVGQVSRTRLRVWVCYETEHSHIFFYVDDFSFDLHLCFHWGGKNSTDWLWRRSHCSPCVYNRFWNFDSWSRWN